MIAISLLFMFPFVTWTAVESTQRLNEYIQYYEPLNYNTKKVHDNHLRAKRSTDSNPYLHLSFEAQRRRFNIRLKRDTSIFSKISSLRLQMAKIQTSIYHMYTKDTCQVSRKRKFDGWLAL
ncbi:disintegrin and metalloproteinase domain-containing protein 10 [Caerostris extrusa]|uniref:Disintegrin and metalloproteinase domain-containing protein 10 n=1 Tax=Caerostris extrusa TaxID=172846 RepID=A0AAV4VSB0_CAEEX|nr:disintegrin and metalloproteinase domain-containing protein 10 [Caerostris extrusa]